MLSIAPFGILVVPRVYVVMGVIAEFIISNLLEKNNQVEQAESLLSIRSIMGDRSSIRGFVVPIGRPRYVNGMDPIWHPNVLARI